MNENPIPEADKNGSPGAHFERLIKIVAILRSPNGCPWDRKQTLETLAPYMVEEAHEVAEAVTRDDNELLREELGDVLLEVALMARVAEEDSHFSVCDSLESICEKLIRRHPHVFGGGDASDEEAVKRSWAELKAAEKPNRGAVDGVPTTLPALHRARRVTEKAAGVGFDWPDVSGVIDKIDEELGEVKREVADNDVERVGEEIGDLLFATVNLARHLNVDPEKALQETTDKFIKRFEFVEDGLKGSGKTTTEATLEEMDELWETAKSILSGG